MAEEMPLENNGRGPSPTNRKMVRAVLMGSHSHPTRHGSDVHVYQRGTGFLARGYYEKRQFGETLGTNELEATTRLRELLGEIDNQTYVRPSESRRRPLRKLDHRRATVRQLVDTFLADVRKRRGKETAGTYQSRLMHALDFVEGSNNRKRWTHAESIDRDFIVSYRAFLYQRQVAPNGRPGAPQQPMSVRGVRNALECLRTMLAWAHRADVRQLPADWVNPVTVELIGTGQAKDPLREDPLPPEVRVRLVQQMDAWQLCHLALSMVLPLRPGEAVGLLVSEVDFDKGWLTIGTRLDGADFTKGKTSYKLPFPKEFDRLLNACIAGRAQGPLLRCRKDFSAQANRSTIEPDQLLPLYRAKLAKARPDEIQSEQDRKRLFRALLRDLGGVTENVLAKEFDKIVARVGLNTKVKFYDLRHATTKGLKDAKIPHLDLLYLTAHTTSSILNDYTPVNPVRSMQEYFATIRPLLVAIDDRATALGFSQRDPKSTAEDLNEVTMNGKRTKEA